MTVEEAGALAALGAAAAGGQPTRLIEALAEAVRFASSSEIEELLLQTYLFAGFPRTIEAFVTWQGWATRGAGRGARTNEAQDLDLWRARGEKLCRLVYGANFEALQRRLARLHPALAEWTLVEGYGKVLSRPGPGPDVREMTAVGALVALGARRQLASHLRGALNAGVRRSTLVPATRAVAARWDRVPLVEEVLTELDDG